jgi:thioesterase domain-containing protein/acyl carrier protein
VAAAVVMVEGQDTHRHLVGYLTNRTEVVTSPSELRAFLRNTLPEFMVPDAFVWLDRLPLTPSGKIDRSALGGDRRLEHRPEPVLPRTPTERIVAEIWAQQLGLGSVGVEDDFFERGGHSLLAVNLMAALEVRFGVSLSPALLFKAPTVSAVAKAIDDSGALGRTPRLVSVQTQGSNPPIFALPGGGGSVVAYAQLARELGRHQPFYGLEHPGLQDGETPPDRVELLATSFMEEIRNVHRGQPCVLIGACSGAIVAFELARLLVADGRPVTRVIMLDPSTIGAHRSRAPIAPGWPRLLAARFIAGRLALYARDLRRLKGVARRTYLTEKGRRLGWFVRHPSLFRENARELNRLRVRVATVTALRNYSPHPYDGAVTLIAGERFSAAEHPKNIAPWQKVCTGSLDVHHLAAQTSGEMLRPPVLGDLVRQLTQILYRAERSIVAAAPPSRAQA